jgi:hypothetical protein
MRGVYLADNNRTCAGDVAEGEALDHELEVTFPVLALTPFFGGDGGGKRAADIQIY